MDSFVVELFGNRYLAHGGHDDDGDLCAGRTIQRGGPTRIMNLPDRDVRSFRITGGLIGCDIPEGG